MLGMHGTYEANLSMNQADLHRLRRRAFRRPGHRAAWTPSRRTRPRSTSTSTGPRSTRPCHVDLPIIGDCAHVLRTADRGLGQRARPQDLTEWKKPASTSGRRARTAWPIRKSETAIMPQFAIQRLYELTKDRNPIIATEVGQHQMWAAQHLPFLRSQPLAHLGRPWHDGLWPARGDRGAARQSRQRPSHRHCRRRLDPDEHPGARHGHAVSACRSRCSSSTTSGWAWSASGRS